MKQERSFGDIDRADRGASFSGHLRVLFLTDGASPRNLPEYLCSAGLIVEVLTAPRRGAPADVCSAYDVLILHQSRSGTRRVARLITMLQGRNCPGILVLGSSSCEADKIAALELGADDYQDITCQPRELLARIRAVARRRSASSVPAVDLSVQEGSEIEGRYSFGGWSLDVWNNRMTNPEGMPIRLTMSETKILMAIVENPNGVISRDQLTKILGRFDAEGPHRPIDLFVSRLRKKLSVHHAAEIIVTERGAGYAYNRTLGQVNKS